MNKRYLKKVTSKISSIVFSPKENNLRVSEDIRDLITPQ